MEDINAGVARFKATPGAILIDLRDAEDFAEEHIPRAINMRLDTIREDMEEIADPDTPIFLYCYGGMRSYQAEALLQARGFGQAASIGGMDHYKGPLEQGETNT